MCNFVHGKVKEKENIEKNRGEKFLDRRLLRLILILEVEIMGPQSVFYDVCLLLQYLS